MLNNVKPVKVLQNCVVAALLLTVGVSAGSVSQVAAQPDVSTPDTVHFVNSIQTASPVAEEAEQALTEFIRGMDEGDAKTVWMYASEEDQAAFETEDAVYEAFAEAFPAFTQAERVTFNSFRNEGDTPFVVLSMTDEAGEAYSADVGLWLDDAGDWKIVSLDIVAASEHVASL
jgi:hypothetical protein